MVRLCLISVPNLKEIHFEESCFFLAQSCKSMRRRKMLRKLGNFQKHISHKLLILIFSNLICKVVYIEGIKYVNLIEIGSVVVEI